MSWVVMRFISASAALEGSWNCVNFEFRGKGMLSELPRDFGLLGPNHFPRLDSLFLIREILFYFLSEIHMVIFY